MRVESRAHTAVACAQQAWCVLHGYAQPHMWKVLMLEKNGHSLRTLQRARYL